jgi:hypothetical protein
VEPRQSPTDASRFCPSARTSCAVSSEPGCVQIASIRSLSRAIYGVTDAHEIRVDQLLRETHLVTDSRDCKRSALPLS